MNKINLPVCYKCKKPKSKMLSMDAPGTYYMCTDCIEKTEKKENKVGVFSYRNGLRFYTKEEAEQLTGETIE